MAQKNRHCQLFVFSDQGIDVGGGVCFCEELCVRNELILHLINGLFSFCIKKNKTSVL